MSTARPTGTASSDEPIPVEQLGYEQARDELVTVVRTLELGGLDLDESLTLWERGEALANRCEEHLAGASARIERALGTDDDPEEDSEDDLAEEIDDDIDGFDDPDEE